MGKLLRAVLVTGQTRNQNRLLYRELPQIANYLLSTTFYYKKDNCKGKNKDEVFTSVGYFFVPFNNY